MSEAVKRSEVTEKDLFGDVRHSLESTQKVLDAYNEGLRESAKLNKRILEQGSGKTSKSIREVESSIIAVSKAEKEYIKLLQEQEKLDKLKIQTQKAEIDLTNKQEAAQRRHNKQLKDENIHYKELVKKTRELKNKSKDLGAQLLKLEQEGKKGTREYRRLERQYIRTTKEARAFDRQLKKIDATAGDHFRKVGNYPKIVNGLRSSLAQLGLAFGVFEILRKSITVLRDFDQSMQNLTAITGENTDKLRELAKELGETTVFTASQAADAMTKLAMAGFNTNQILAATPGVLDLAAAGQLGLAEAADIASNVLSGFGLSAEETNRVVDVIAKTATSTNTTVQTLGESFKEIAPTANNLKIPIEEVAAVVGLLGNSGIKGTDATTSLNTALVRLSDPTKEMKDKMKELNVEFFDANGQFIGITNVVRVLNERMSDFTDEQKAQAISVLFGARANKQMTSLLLGQTVAMKDGTEEVLRGADALDHLTKEYQNASGAAKEMADTQIDSLGGAFAKLRSAFEGFIINLSDSTSGANGLKNTIVFLAENLSTVLKVIGQVVLAFGTYKAIQISVRLQQTLLNKEMLKSIFSFKGLSKSVKGASGDVSKFATNLRAIGWTAAIALASELVMQFWDIASGTEAARMALERYNEELQSGQKFGSETVRQIRETLEERQRELKLQLSRREITKVQFEEEMKLAKSRAEARIKAEIQIANAEKKRKKELGDKAGVTFENETLKQLIALQKELKNAREDEEIAKNTQTESTKKSTKSNEEEALSVTDLVDLYDVLFGERKKIVELNEVQRKQISEEDIIAANEAINNRRRTIAEIQVLNAELFGSEKDLREARINQIRENLAIELENIELTVNEREALEKRAQKEIADIEKEALKDRIKQQREYFKLAQEFFTKNSEKRIEQIDKEIDAAEKQLEVFQRLAESGNIQANQSLKQQQALIEQANRRRIEEEKRLQRIKQATVLLDVYSSKVEAGDKTPLVSTIRDVQVLRSFIASLPAFKEGVDRTDNKGQNVDGKHGFLSVLHPDEQVRTAEQNKRSGYMPAEDITRLAEKYNSGLLVDPERFHGATQIFNAWDMTPLIKEVKEMKDAVKNMPEYYHYIESVNSSISKLVSTQKKGNLTRKKIDIIRNGN